MQTPPSTRSAAVRAAVRGFVREFSPRDTALAVGVAVLAVQAAALLAYLTIRQPVVTGYRPLVYPVVWITASVVSAVWVGRTVESRQRRGLGLAVGGGYTLGLLWLSGMLAAGSGAGSGALMVHTALPGWGPIVHYHGPLVGLSVVPFKLVAFLALGYIVSVLVAATGGSILAAVLGVASCVSCTASALLASAGAVGGTQLSSLVSLAGYEAATGVLLVTFGLLVRAAQRATPRPES